MMDRDLIDISLPLSAHLPIWPGSPGVQIKALKRLDMGDDANVSQLTCDVHAGTHVDAPFHFLNDGLKVEDLSFKALLGPALVVDLGEAKVIDAALLEQHPIPNDAKRILFKTRNSKLWEQRVSEFQPTFTALDTTAARWLVSRSVALVGIDYLSIQLYEGERETHEALLASNVVILEGLNLSKVEPGLYELICLPLLLQGAEGAPARAVLRLLP